MQNHLEISSKSQFWIRNVEIGGKHKENIFLMHFYEKMLCVASRQWFLMVLTCSWVSWPKNDAERFGNYFKKSVLDPEHSKFDQNPSFGHVRAVGGIMGYSGSVNFKHLLQYLCSDMLRKAGAYRTDVIRWTDICKASWRISRARRGLPRVPDMHRSTPFKLIP